MSRTGRPTWRLKRAAVVLLAFALAALVVGRQHRAAVRAAQRDHLVATARALRGAAGGVLSSEASEETLQWLSAIGRESASRVAVVGREGALRLDAGRSGQGALDVNDLEEFVGARAVGLGSASRTSSGGVRSIHVAVPVERRGELIGFVRVSAPVVQPVASSNGIGLTLLGFGFGAGLVMLWLDRVRDRRLEAQLATVTAAARAIADGQLEVRLADRVAIGPLDGVVRDLDGTLDALTQRLERTRTERNDLQAILAGMVEGVVAIDRDQRVVYINQVAGELLRTTPQAATLRPIWEVSRLTGINAVLSEVVDAGHELRRQVRLADLPGERVLAVHAAPLLDAEGQPNGAVVVLHDVTQLRRLQTIRQDFVANVSHELKTPVTALRGLAETIVDDPEMPAETRLGFLHRMIAQTGRLSTLVTDLLTLSRFESEGGTPDMRRLDLRSTLQESVRAHSGDAEGKQLSMGIQVPEQPVWVRGDEEALRQVADNLLTNAIRYTPEGGIVRVRLQRVDDQAQLEVEDSGIGIEPADRTRIFERFYRVDKARSRELGGTGLGLSIVKHIVLAHGGEVSVDSILGGGSTFRVVLPWGG